MSVKDRLAFFESLAKAGEKDNVPPLKSKPSNSEKPAPAPPQKSPPTPVQEFKKT